MIPDYSIRNIGRILLLLCLLTSCGAQEKEQQISYQGIEDLKGKKVATLTGSFQETILAKDYPEIEVMRFDSTLQ